MFLHLILAFPIYTSFYKLKSSTAVIICIQSSPFTINVAKMPTAANSFLSFAAYFGFKVQ